MIRPLKEPSPLHNSQSRLHDNIGNGMSPHSSLRNSYDEVLDDEVEMGEAARLTARGDQKVGSTSVASTGSAQPLGRTVVPAIIMIRKSTLGMLRGYR